MDGRKDFNCAWAHQDQTASIAKEQGNLQQVLASGRRLSYIPNIEHIVS